MMRTYVVLAIVLVASFSATPLPAQESKQPSSQTESVLVGQPVYSSDGQKLGEITSTTSAVGKTALRVEMGTFLGLGPSQVLVDPDVFKKKNGRIELTMTAAEVKERIARQNEKK